jgi:Tfp pilus assembly protein PilN
MFEIPTKQQELVATEAKITQAKKDLDQVNQLKERNSSLKMRQKVLNYLVSKGRRWSSYMDALQFNTPKGVQIDHVVFGSQDFQIEGVATDFTSVSNLNLNLESSPLIRESSIDYASRKDKSPQFVSFGLTAKLNAVMLPKTGSPSSNATPNQAPSIGVLPINGEAQ